MPPAPGEPLTGSEVRQVRIAEWLEEKRPDIASMYRSARGLLASPSQPGDERTRVSHICHSMREVMIRLPAVIGNGGTGKRVVRSADYVRNLPEILLRYPALDLFQDAENVPVPREIARVLGDIIRAAVSENGRILANIATFLTDDGNTKHPAVREWHKTYNYFVKWAHLHDSQSSLDTLPSDDDLLERITAIEALMDGKRAEFFDSLHEIEDILAAANQLIDGDADNA